MLAVTSIFLKKAPRAARAELNASDMLLTPSGYDTCISAFWGKTLILIQGRVSPNTCRDNPLSRRSRKWLSASVCRVIHSCNRLVLS